MPEPWDVTGPDGPTPTGHELLRARADERVQLTGLTDAELVAAMPPGTRSPVPLPWLTSLDQAARDLAVDAARRSLLARTDLTIDAGGTLRPGPVLDATLRIRSSSRVTLLAEQQTANAAQFAAAYLEDAGTAVVEQADVGGIHRFWSMSERDAVRRLLFWAAPSTPNVAEDDFVQEIPVEQWQTTAPTLLAGTTRTTSIVRSDGGEESADRRLSVFERPNGVYLLRPVGRATLDLRAVGVDALHDALGALTVDAPPR